MTVTRLGQLTAELQTLDDVIVLGVSGPTISSTKARTGTYSYQFSTATYPAGLSIPVTTHLRAGYWLNHNGVVSDDKVLVYIWQAESDIQYSWISWDPDAGDLLLYIRGVLEDSVSAASVGFNTLDTWMHCGLHVHTGASASVSFYLNGVRVLHYEGSGAGSDVSALYFCGDTDLIFKWNDYAYVDDFYVDELSADELDTAPPSKRFLFALVNAAGANAEFTPVGAGSNYQAVDDSSGPDDDSTYNKALDPSLKDTFNTSDITVPADYVIRAAIPVAIAKKTDAGGDQALKLHMFDGATYDSSDPMILTTSYSTIWERFPLQPDDSVWNETDFNAMQAGYESATE